MLIYNTLPYKFPFIRCTLSDKAHIRPYGKYMMIIVHHNIDYIIGIHCGPNLIVSFEHDNLRTSNMVYLPIYTTRFAPPKWNRDHGVYGFESITHNIPIIDRSGECDVKYNSL